MGRSRISFSKKSRPSIFGISTSSVSTSGLSALIISRAAMGSGAAPTTSMSGCALITSFSTLRINAESSTTTTLILPLTAIGLQLTCALRTGMPQVNNSTSPSTEALLRRALYSLSRSTMVSLWTLRSFLTSTLPVCGKK